MVGTPAYMSPEQADGRKLDGRSDIFSFGSVLYEMVTGRQAFTGASRLSVLAKILNEEPAPSLLATAVPSELEKTILRCLRKDPARRYQTMADLKVALEELGRRGWSGNGTAASRAGAASAMAMGCCRCRASDFGRGVFAVNAARRPGSPEPVHALPLTSLSGQVRLPTLSPDGNQVAFTWTGEKQDNHDLYVQQIGAGSPHKLTTDPGDDSSPAWSPDGLAIAFLRRQPNSGRYQVRLVPPLGGPERKIAEIEPGSASTAR